MTLLWIGTIFYFQIPLINWSRSLFVIVTLTMLVYISDFLRKRKNEEKEREKIISEK